MTVIQKSNLGRALTVLGLEDKFLSNGELSNFPLLERGKIANDIISEKLNHGRWEKVVDMIFGGFGKADALYEGNREQLKNDIVKSAIKKTESIKEGTIIILRKAGENDLLFRFATEIPSLKYETFDQLMRYGSFEKDIEGDDKLKRLHEAGGKIALKENNYSSAFFHFNRIKDWSGIDNVFNEILNDRWNSADEEFIERIALTDPEKKEHRLKRLATGFSKIKGCSALYSYKIHKKYNIHLDENELKKLKRALARDLDIFDLERNIPETELELRLAWAKNHAKSSPKSAYEIFKQQDYKGHFAVDAVIAGLDKYPYYHVEAFTINSVKEFYLRKAYEKTSFYVKLSIALHLKDKEKLKKLSREAYANKNLDQAYELWIKGEGNLEDKYLENVRKKLIDDKIIKNAGFVYLLDKSDTKGMEKAYDKLVSSKIGEKSHNLRGAYEIALQLGDEDRIQRTRKAMIALSPTWALRHFVRHRGNDEKGINYVLENVAGQNNLTVEELRGFFNKYNKD